MAPATEARRPGRGEVHALPVDSTTGDATSVTQTIKTESGATLKLPDPTAQQRLPWLVTDEESETEAEDIHSWGSC